MKSYIIPTVELKPDATVIHCGTSDLRRQEQPEEIAYKIAILTSSIKLKKNEVVVSGIVTRSHINRRGLHLTTIGSKIVGDNIVKFTKNLLFTK